MECDSTSRSQAPCVPASEEYISCGRVPNSWKNQPDGRPAASIPTESIERDSSASADASRVKVKVESHPLRWDKTSNTPRLVAHRHPLRLIRSEYLYPSSNGSYVCDIGHHRPTKAGYVFNCALCEFDICLECVSKPCFTCTSFNCCHTQITMKMV